MPDRSAVLIADAPASAETGAPPATAAARAADAPTARVRWTAGRTSGRTASGPTIGRRSRAPWVASVVLHGLAFVVLARSAAPRSNPAELQFTVQLAAAPAEADEVPVDDAAIEPPSDEDLVVSELPPVEAPLPEPPPLEPEETTEVDEREALPAAPMPAPFPVGPRTVTTRTHRPPPAPVEAPPPPVRPQAVAAPAPAPSTGTSAVIGARPDARNQPPVYPADARANRWTGVVTLRLDVDASGAVRGVAIAVSSGHASLDRAAAEAAWGWRFTPALRDGVPLASSVLRRVRFVLDGV